jgi:hypothetical protein
VLDPTLMHSAAALRSTRSRSARSLGAFAVAAAMAITGLSGCGGDDRPQPTLSSVNFTPKLIVTMSDRHLVLSKGPRDDATISFGGPDATMPDPKFPGGPTEATVPAGTVIEVVNDGPGTHRLQGDTVFDTGVLRKGERTTVVLTNDGSTDKRIAVTDPTDAAVAGAIIVRPKPAS